MTKIKKEHILLLESIDLKIRILLDLVIACGLKLDAMGTGGSAKMLIPKECRFNC
jgi:hypothetical protein